MGQTVNLLVYAYGGSNPSAPTVYVKCDPVTRQRSDITNAEVAQLVER
jgi:hypothetical protein